MIKCCVHKSNVVRKSKAYFYNKAENLVHTFYNSSPKPHKHESNKTARLTYTSRIDK